MLSLNVTFYQMFWTYMKSLYPRMKAYISMNILLVSKTCTCTEQTVSAIVYRRRLFLDKMSFINRRVFVSNILRSSFRRLLRKQLIINVIT